MAVAVDASSPAQATNAGTTTTTTTATFSPPAGSVIVAAYVTDDPASQIHTAAASNSGTALTWTKTVERNNNAAGGYAAIYWAYNASAQTNITVTVTQQNAQNLAGALKVYVLTGADTTTPIVASAGQAWTAAATTALSVTNGTRAGGLYIGAAIDWNQTGTPTSSDLSPIYTTNQAGKVATGIGSRAATTASTSYSGTFTFGTSSAQGQQVAVIVQPAAGGSSFSGSAPLSGSGTLTLAGSPAPTGTLTLSGSGTLAESGVPKPTGTVALSGSGTLTTSATITTSGALALSGSGSLSLLPPTIASGSVALSGSGTLTLSGVPGFTFVISMIGFSGSGQLAVSATPAFSDVLALSSQGALTLSGRAALWKFTGPSFLEWRPFQLNPPVRLQYAIPYGSTVWRDSAGVWHQQYAPSLADLAGASAAYTGGPATVVYGGGRKWPLTDQQRADLTAAGYAANIILEPLP